MSSLHITNSKAAGKGAATKRKLPTYEYDEGKPCSKENQQIPTVPTRTKRQKLCSRTPPAKVNNS